GAGVEAEQAGAVRRAKQARGLAHVAAEPMLKDERNTLADVEGMEGDAVALEAGHQRTPAAAAGCVSASATWRHARVLPTSASASPCTISGTGTWRRRVR